MELKQATIYTIDRQNNITIKNIPDDSIKFDDYFHEILITMADNKIVKNYKSKAATTQVLNCIKKIIDNQNEPTDCEVFFESISKRLLEKELWAQSKIEKMQKSVQVGSLMQALFYDGDNERYMFLLAKVAHIVFVNQVGLSDTQGFPKDIKIYKSATFYIDETSNEEIGVQLHQDTITKYWYDEFLELIELTNDEENTKNAFNAIDGFLNRKIKQKYPKDRAFLRNSFIHYFRTNATMDYDSMIDDIFNDYSPIDELFPREQFKNELLELPEKKKFDDYFHEILITMADNKIVKNYKSKAATTQVLNCIKKIIDNQNEPTDCEVFFESISKRLLEKELWAQSKIEKMQKSVQVGSLMQALFYDGDNERYMFLLAKVAHIVFVNQVGLSDTQGFPKDIKIYKSATFYIDETSNEEIGVQLHQDTITKYWYDEFLELIELTNDEENTKNAFNAIDGFLNRKIKQKYPKDRAFLRNSFIHYFRTNATMDYDSMIDDIFNDYSPIDELFPREQFKNELLELPEKKKFERNFQVVADIVKARIRTNYEVYPGIRLTVSENREVIETYIEQGKKYLKIQVTDETTYLEFTHRNDNI